MDDLLRLLDRARAADALAARARERLLRTVAEEGATLAGTLVDLAEAGAEVRVRTTFGRPASGPVRFVGSDFAVVGDVWVRLSAIVAVLGASSPAAGDRAPSDVLLSEALHRIATERPRVALATPGEVLAGELVAAGVDVVTVRLDGEAGLAYVPVASVLGLRSG